MEHNCYDVMGEEFWNNIFLFFKKTLKNKNSSVYDYLEENNNLDRYCIFFLRRLWDAYYNNKIKKDSSGQYSFNNSSTKDPYIIYFFQKDPSFFYSARNEFENQVNYFIELDEEDVDKFLRNVYRRAKSQVLSMMKVGMKSVNYGMYSLLENEKKLNEYCEIILDGYARQFYEASNNWDYSDYIEKIRCEIVKFKEISLVSPDKLIERLLGLNESLPPRDFD